MKRVVTIFLAAVLLLSGSLAAGQAQVASDRYEAAEKTRAELWKAKKYRQALEGLLALYRSGDFLDLPAEKRIDLLYNTACGCSLVGDKARAVSFLEQALAAGYRDYYNVIADPDFANVRKDKDFQALVAKLKAVGDYGQILKGHAAYKPQPELVLPEFTYQAAAESELQELRRTYRLDEAAGQGDDVSRIINLMRWVHKKIRHDGSSMNPDPRNALNILGVCASGQRGVNCRMLATVLNEVYLAMGFRSRHITCLPGWRDDPDCHVINIVYAPSLNKWLYMDPSFEAYFRNEKGELLSIAEVREGIVRDGALVLDKEANWNGQATDPAWYLHYMSKNLYRLSCPAASEFGYESKPVHVRVYLEPADTPLPASTARDLYTTDAGRFWSLPAGRTP